MLIERKTDGVVHMTSFELTDVITDYNIVLLRLANCGFPYIVSVLVYGREKHPYMFILVHMYVRYSAEFNKYTP